ALSAVPARRLLQALHVRGDRLHVVRAQRRGDVAHHLVRIGAAFVRGIQLQLVDDVGGVLAGDGGVFRRGVALAGGAVAGDAGGHAVGGNATVVDAFASFHERGIGRARLRLLRGEVRG